MSFRDYATRRIFGLSRDELGANLFIAAYRGDALAVQGNLAHGAPPGWSDSRDGFSPLLAAAQSGNLFIVELLLAAGANPNQPCLDGDTALSRAAAYAHPTVVARLLGPTDPELADRAGYRAIERAINFNPNAARCVEILAAKSDLSRICEHRGLTPLQMAIDAEVVPCADVLLAAAQADALECSKWARSRGKDKIADHLFAASVRAEAAKLDKSIAGFARPRGPALRV